MTVPIYLLSGFLGSGKTTLLTQMVEQAQAAGLTPAVLMNELGEVNLDGQLVNKNIAMAEVLGGCICCSMRGDLSLELHGLLERYQPDLVIVESTGAAHPMESIDAITETSMYRHAVLQEIVTVVDSEHLLARATSPSDKTLRLMKDQIRCATLVLVNKVDRLHQEQLVEVLQLVHELNPYAKVVTTTACQLEDWQWVVKPQLDSYHGAAAVEQRQDKGQATNAQQYDEKGQAHDVSHEAGQSSCCNHSHEAEHSAECNHRHEAASHHTHESKASHEHVMAYTHYWRQPPHSEQFEAWLDALPENIYRAKGIITFRDVPSRFLFQYAFRESDFMRIDPQGEVHDVAVFIGEHFDASWLKGELERLEQPEE